MLVEVEPDDPPADAEKESDAEDDGDLPPPPPITMVLDEAIEAFSSSRFSWDPRACPS